MGKRKYLTEEQEARILRLKEEGLSSRIIAKVVLGSESKKSTVNDFLARQIGFVHPDDMFPKIEYDPREVAFNRKTPSKVLGYKDVQEAAKVGNTAFEKFVRFKDDNEHDNSRILIISDLHIPYQHKDALAFLQHLKNKYNPTRVICMGDELDKHALSFHDSDPDLASAGDELSRALPIVAELFKMFPKMDILESNHGSLVYRKAKHHGIPRAYIKGYNDVLGVDSGWKWWYDMTIDLPNGTQCYFHHGKSSEVKNLSQTMSMCAVQGHYHESFKIDYWGNPNGLFWGMQTACLIDDNSLAFSYNNVNVKRPVIGTGLIIDGLPILEPMVIKNGRWVGAN